MHFDFGSSQKCWHNSMHIECFRYFPAKQWPPASLSTVRQQKSNENSTLKPEENAHKFSTFIQIFSDEIFIYYHHRRRSLVGYKLQLMIICDCIMPQLLANARRPAACSSARAISAWPAIECETVGVVWVLTQLQADTVHRLRRHFLHNTEQCECVA